MATINEEGKSARTELPKVSGERTKSGTGFIIKPLLLQPLNFSRRKQTEPIIQEFKSHRKKYSKSLVFIWLTRPLGHADAGDKKFRSILKKGRNKGSDNENNSNTQSKGKKPKVVFKDKLEEVFQVESYKHYNLEFEAQPSCACRIF